MVEGKCDSLFPMQVPTPLLVKVSCSWPCLVMKVMTLCSKAWSLAHETKRGIITPNLEMEQ